MNMKNYTKIEERYIEEISSNVTLYEHNKSGARVCTIKNEDNNKVFSIAFRTPPINDTGLTHILEHSVLCGSKKFPVKDPFVELIKSSLNTFINAFTFEDKTMYPVASQNDKDFHNLMHVYMDAVFYPRIYDHEEIFKQEGWHYHLENIEDPITINGVVYNEMKGAFSDPTQVLYSKIEEALFPDTAYHFVSGGDPKYIPELSYSQFKDFHSKFYHPSNSYIMIYGNSDMDERMEWLDSEYLSKFNRIDFDTRLQFQQPFDKPKKLVSYYPVDKGTDLSNKTYLSYNVVFPTTFDTKLMIATAILLNALFDVPGAPLKQALLDAKIGVDVSSLFDDGVLQPILSIIAENANECDLDRFVSIIDGELEKILSNGLDKESLIALLNHAEFAQRERNFSPRSPQGLDIIITMMGSFLYDDKDPFSKITVLKYYKELKEDINKGYFENIIQNYLLKNNHKAYVVLVPSETVNDEKNLELENKLKAYKESLSESDLLDLVKSTNALKEYQNKEDSIEAINTLPKLSLEDINPKPEAYKLEVIDSKYKVLFSEYPTNEISYVSYYFDISHMRSEELKYIALYADLFKQLSTSKMHYKDINQFIQNSLGSVVAQVMPLKHYETKEALLYFSIGFSALTKNIKDAFSLVNDLMFDVKFDDEKRLFEYLSMLKSNLENSIISRGHVMAMQRAFSYIDENSYQKDIVGGISYVDFVSNLVSNFENKKKEIIANLYRVQDKVFSKENLTVGYTGSREDYKTIIPYLDETIMSLRDSISYPKEVFKENALNEAFTAPIDVNYVSRVGKFSGKFNTGVSVLQNAMSMDYLWMEVRVHGGAYGCMMNIDPSGLIGFTSYRDPNIKSTNDVYQNADQFVLSFNPSDEELLKFKIGTIGGIDTVLHNKAKASIARSNYLRGLSEEERCKNRKELLSIKNEDFKEFASWFKEAMSSYNITVIGNTNKINENKDMFKTIRPLKK